MSESKAMGRAALIVAVGILLSRILGFVRTAVIGGVLGVSADTTLYVNAFTIPDYLYFLMAGGYLSITLVPVLNRRMVDGDVTDETNRAFTTVIRFVAIALGSITVLALIFTPQLVAFVFPRITEQARLSHLTRIAFASQVFFGLGTILMAAQYARKRFLIPTMAPLIYNLSIILGGLVGWAVGNRSEAPFLWGGLVGAVVGNFALQAWGARREGFRIVAGTRWRNPALKEYLVTAFPLMIGISAVALDEQWPRIFGQFVGQEATAAVDFARKLNMMPVGMIAQAAGVAAYPFLVSLAIKGDLAGLGAAVNRSVRSSMAVGGLAAAGVIALAQPLTMLAYQRGAFTPADTVFVASILVLYALAIPLWPAHQVYTRGFYSMSRMWTPVWVGSSITLILLPILWLLTDRLGATGIATGSSIGIALYTLAIGAAWHRSVSTDDALPTFIYGAKVFAATAVAAGGARTVMTLVFGADVASGYLEALGQLLIGGLVALGLFLAMAKVLNIAEAVDFAVALFSRGLAMVKQPNSEPPSRPAPDADTDRRTDPTVPSTGRGRPVPPGDPRR